jgi:hypothetical protein
MAQRSVLIVRHFQGAVRRSMAYSSVELVSFRALVFRQLL